jgi:hypothetical protein
MNQNELLKDYYYHVKSIITPLSPDHFYSLVTIQHNQLILEVFVLY